MATPQEQKVTILIGSDVPEALFPLEENKTRENKTATCSTNIAGVDCYGTAERKEG